MSSLEEGQYKHMKNKIWKKSFPVLFRGCLPRDGWQQKTSFFPYCCLTIPGAPNIRCCVPAGRAGCIAVVDACSMVSSCIWRRSKVWMWFFLFLKSQVQAFGKAWLFMWDLGAPNNFLFVIHRVLTGSLHGWCNTYTFIVHLLKWFFIS